MVESFIALGSNMGDRHRYIEQALALLRQTPGITVETVSSLIETQACGGPAQGPYINGVARIRTSCSPADLLKILQMIEASLGRTRVVKNGPRTIDLDILMYGDTVMQSSDLILPHPRMRERDFVMRPLREIEPKIEERF